MRSCPPRIPSSVVRDSALQRAASAVTQFRNIGPLPRADPLPAKAKVESRQSTSPEHETLEQLSLRYCANTCDVNTCSIRRCVSVQETKEHVTPTAWVIFAVKHRKHVVIHGTRKDTRRARAMLKSQTGSRSIFATLLLPVEVSFQLRGNSKWQEESATQDTSPGHSVCWAQLMYYCLAASGTVAERLRMSVEALQSAAKSPALAPSCELLVLAAHEDL